MNLKSGLVLTVTLALCGTMAQAAGTANIGAAVERELTKQVQKAEEYKGFNPHLTQAQMDEIPALLEKASARLQKAGYQYKASDVVDGLRMYFEVSDGLNGYPTSEHMGEVLGGKVEGPISGDLIAHARAYAMEKVIPAKYQNAAYKMPKYEVKNWKQFHYLCQYCMEDLYGVLKELETCEWDTFRSILCNLL